MSGKKYLPTLDQDVSQIIDSLLGELPSEEYTEVKLPSLATKIYGLESEYLHLRPITFEDEKAMLSLKDKNKFGNLLIQRCVKEEINVDDLIVPDKFLILLNLRAISVGKEYSLNITCSKCSTINKIGIDLLNTFPVNYAEEPLEKAETITLPKVGKGVQVKRASSSDLEKDITEVLESLWRFVLKVDQYTDAKVRKAFIDRLPREDVHTILNVVMSSNIGVDPRFMFHCSKCGHNELTNFEFSNDFFTMQ